MASCPFCSDILLRHVRSGQSYWLCRRCRTEILDHPVEPQSGDRLPVEVVNDSVISASGKISAIMPSNNSVSL